MKMPSLCFRYSAFSLVIFPAILFCKAHIKECRSSVFGFDYMGKRSTTRQGLECQSWSSQWPHVHSHNDSRHFPDQSLTYAGNYCRNPDEWLGGLWCYTTNSSVRWQTCDVPKCADFPECRISETGSEYRGNIGVTRSGKSCVSWPDSLNLKKEVSGTCRNPDHNDGGPWCYVSKDFEDWEYCNVPFCKPSMYCKRSYFGWEYSGTKSRTIDGRACQRWDHQYPHTHDYTDPDLFPDDTLADASNLCRNPDSTIGGPWCYTQDPNLRWGYCDISRCAECRVSDVAETYSGSISKTASGRGCQRWDSQTPHEHSMTDPDRFPDYNISSAENFCRNPDRRQSGPWCYTTDKHVIWESCNIPFCSGDAASGKSAKPIARHILHIGVDGLRSSCFPKAPGGAKNMLGRIRDHGAWTMDRGRTVLQTVSAPAWSGILCGMNVEQDGVVNNLWTPPWLGTEVSITPVTGESVPFPCIFDELKGVDSNIRTAAFHSWWFFQYVTNRGHPGMVDKDFFYEYSLRGAHIGDSYVTGNATEYLQQIFKSSESSYTFVYLTETDVAGHTYEWCSDQYLTAVASADRNVGKLLDVLEEVGMQDEVLVILNTDHGGIRFNHGDMADHDLIVPLFIRGPGIKENHEFQHDVSVTDVPPTIMHALGQKYSPWWSGKIIEEAFERKAVHD